ncbi:unnamed protein product, partial [Effrenium voratum]
SKSSKTLNEVRLMGGQAGQTLVDGYPSPDLRLTRCVVVSDAELGMGLTSKFKETEAKANSGSLGSCAATRFMVERLQEQKVLIQEARQSKLISQTKTKGKMSDVLQNLKKAKAEDDGLYVSEDEDAPAEADEDEVRDADVVAGVKTRAKDSDPYKKRSYANGWSESLWLDVFKMLSPAVVVAL